MELTGGLPSVLNTKPGSSDSSPALLSLMRSRAMDLSGYCLNKNQESRILNALWEALYEEWPRPKGWHPRPDEVAELRLEVVIGLGFIGQEIVRLWLDDEGYPRKKPTKGPSTKPGWVSRDKRWARFRRTDAD